MSVTLEALGWDERHARTFDELVERLHKRDLMPGRIVRQERKLLRVATPEGELDAKNAGRLVRASSSEQLPVIGDWVAVSPAPGGGEGLIHAVLPRRNVLIRREAGSEHRGQAMAANMDQVLIVWGLDRDLNARWLERAASLVRTSAAPLLIVLSKADLTGDLGAAERAARAAAPEAEVVVVSAQTGFGFDALWPRLPARSTNAVLGMSGAGKSTLINRLLGTEKMATAEVREADRKGRHTTTHRELLPLANGALLIDSPGMRELGLWAGAETSVGDTFTDVGELAQACRFSDCRHHAEPGCAVRGAVERGEFEAGRLESFQKLQRELEAKERATDPAVTRERKRQERNVTRAAWDASRSKRRK
ncbi:MAG: ribosome small subunit-dependent GTPase A [Myxococcaceae bacterium]